MKVQRYKTCWMAANSRVRHTATPLKHRKVQGDDDQSGHVIAQENTKSTATMQNIMIRERNMG